MAPGRGVLQNGTLRQQVIYAFFGEYFILSIILGWTHPRLGFSNNTHHTLLQGLSLLCLVEFLTHGRPQGTVNNNVYYDNDLPNAFHLRISTGYVNTH